MTNADSRELSRCELGYCGGYETGGVTETLKAYLEESLVKIDSLTAHISELQDAREYIEGEIKKTQFALTVFEDNAEITVSPQIAEEDKSVEGETDALSCGRATVRDIKGCGSQRKAAYIIARINGGLLDLNPASELIVAAELSKSTPRVVSGTLHTYLSNNEDFEWIAPSTFRLNSDSEDELTTGDEMALSEHLKRVA